MPVNAPGRRSVLNVNNADGSIFLITFTHSTFVTQRLALAMNDVTSSADGTGSQTYTAFPFELELPTDDKGVPTGSIRLSNITHQILTLIRDIQSPPPQLNIFRVLESDVNTVQDSFLYLDIMEIRANMLSLDATFSHENYAVEPYPAARVIPPYAPWMQFVG